MVLTHKTALETDGSLQKNPFELPLVKYACWGIAVVLLVDIFNLGQDIFGQEQACTQLEPVDGDIGPGQVLGIHGIVSGSEKEILLFPKTIDQFPGQLGSGPVLGLGIGLALGMFKGTEKLQTFILYKGVEHKCGDLIGQTGVIASRSEVSSGSGPYFFHDQIISRTTSVGIVEVDVARVPSGVHGPCEP